VFFRVFCIQLSFELKRGGALSGDSKQPERVSWIISIENNSDLLPFCITTQNDWLKKLAPLCHPIRGTTKTIRYVFAKVFPRFASATHEAASSFDWVIAGL